MYKRYVISSIYLNQWSWSLNLVLTSVAVIYKQIIIINYYLSVIMHVFSAYLIWIACLLNMIRRFPKNFIILKYVFWRHFNRPPYTLSVSKNLNLLWSLKYRLFVSFYGGCKNNPFLSFKEVIGCKTRIDCFHSHRKIVTLT